MSEPSQDSALRKSVKVYRAMLTNPALRGKAAEHPEWRAVAKYVRELYREFGRARVREAFQQSTTEKP
jgi:hypothetical protein